MGMSDVKKSNEDNGPTVQEVNVDEESGGTSPHTLITAKVRSPLTFLYYSVVLTALTVVVAIVIGLIQLLTLLRNTVAVSSNSRFWQGVDNAGDYYDVIGGAICASFVVVGLVSVICFKPWRRWVDKERARLRVESSGHGPAELLTVRPEESDRAALPQDPSETEVPAADGGAQKRVAATVGEIHIPDRAESSQRKG